MTALHLIAVNCHDFHKVADIASGVASVAAAVAHFRAQLADPIHVRVYWHNIASPPRPLRDRIAALGFELIVSPRASNGENLNRQIDDAARDGFEIFFRVDGDDTVAPQRFVQQSELLTSGACDLCGSGLHYMPPDGPGYVMLPKARPGARDFIENQFVLHPTMGIRLDAFRRAGLRYWPRRLEDKALLLQARKSGLAIRNIPAVSGTYKVDPAARNLLLQKWLNLRLNVAFLIHSGAVHLLPYALLIFTLHVLLGSNRLRRVRYLVRSRQTPRTSQAAPQEKLRKPVTS